MSRNAILEAAPPAIDTVSGTAAATYDDGFAPLSRCELDPEMYRVFAYAVLGWHRRLPRAGGDACACGKQWLYCEYVDLADKLLWTGVGAWTTENN